MYQVKQIGPNGSNFKCKKKKEIIEVLENNIGGFYYNLGKVFYHNHLTITQILERLTVKSKHK